MSSGNDNKSAKSAVKIVFIAALERSGSTILDLKLGAQPGVVSLGEVWRVIKPHGAGLESVRDRVCSCGELGKDCSLWSTVLKKIEESGAQTLAERYEVFADVVRHVYGKDIVVVDSSKSIQSLWALAETQNAEVKVVFTARDVRGWTESIRSARKRKKELPWKKVFDPDFRFFWVAYLRHNILRLLPFWLPHEWIFRNARIRRNIRKSGCPSRNISYESLVFRTEETTDAILQFLELPSERREQPKKLHSSHVIRGNRTAFTSDPEAPLKYDATWMRLWSPAIIFVLFPWVAWYNKNWVHRVLEQPPEAKATTKS